MLFRGHCGSQKNAQTSGTRDTRHPTLDPLLSRLAAAVCVRAFFIPAYFTPRPFFLALERGPLNLSLLRALLLREVFSLSLFLSVIVYLRTFPGAVNCNFNFNARKGHLNRLYRRGALRERVLCVILLYISGIGRESARFSRSVYKRRLKLLLISHSLHCSIPAYIYSSFGLNNFSR